MIVELDYLAVMTKFFRITNVLLSHFDMILDDLFSLGGEFDLCCWSCVCRAGNVIAHNLVKIVPRGEHVWAVDL